MKLIGLTGGPGMGKTAAGKILNARGIQVIDTDDLARKFVEPGEPALLELQQAFGRSILFPTGHLRREELAAIVFSDPIAREKLESILHPRIKSAWQKTTIDWRLRGFSIGVVVIPLLFETKAEQEFDSIICVACSSATQQSRLRLRGWDNKQIAQRIAAQWPIENKMAKADYVIWTEGSLELVAEQCIRVTNPA